MVKKNVALLAAVAGADAVLVRKRRAIKGKGGKNIVYTGGILCWRSNVLSC